MAGSTPSITQAGVASAISTADAGCVFLGLHAHPEIEFNLVRSGRVRYLVGDRRYDLAAHGMLWLFPRQNHTIIEYSPDFSMWVVLYRPAVLAAFGRRVDNRHLLSQGDPPGDHCRRLPAGEAEALERRLAEAKAYAPEDADLRQAALAYLLPLAWRAFQRAPDAIAPGVVIHPAVERAAGLLRREHLPLGELARRSGLTPSHLSRLFAAQLGATITDFRGQSCLERFFTLYGDGQRITILDAALRAGFGSYPQCHRVCLRLTGLPPSQAVKARRSG